MQSINDTYQRITDTIVKQLEAGTKPWIRPWRNDIRCSLTPRRATGEAYRGINVLMLWISSQIFGYARRQVRNLHAEGARRRRGLFNPLSQRIHRLQCRADREPACPVFQPGR